MAEEYKIKITSLYYSIERKIKKGKFVIVGDDYCLYQKSAKIRVSLELAEGMSAFA